MVEQHNRDPATTPLAVDLDRTLLVTDTLVEHFLGAAFRSPWRAVKALAMLRAGRASFKRAILQGTAIDPDSLLYNRDLVAYLQEQKRAGRALHLVTASDQITADLVARNVGIFDSATGSTPPVNLKGRHKLAYLEQRFPEGFSYAGDSPADLSIWKKASSAVLVGVSPSTRAAFNKLGCPVEYEIDRPPAGLRDWLKLLRIHQWSKNILLLVPLILGQAFFQLHALLAVAVGFVAMGLVASGTYVMNDISDIAADRSHQTKNARPIARGTIDAGQAFCVALVLILLGFFFMATQSLPATWWLLVYLIGTLSYSLVFKCLPMIDVFILGGLYTLRIIIGVCLAAQPLSHWLLMFSFFFFFALAMAKRHVEITKAANRPGAGVEIKGRGYRTTDAPLTLTLGVGTNLVAVLVLSLYVASDIYSRPFYNHPQWLWAPVILVMMWSSRIWLLSHRGELDDDPISFAIHDRISLLLGLVICFTFVLSMI
ncbi:MAG: UbiA family prenyltransferase [Acetobacter sp.]